MKEIKKLLLEPIEFLCCVLTIALTISVPLGVFDRFIFRMSFSWTSELARYCFIWMCFLAAALTTKKKGHFFVDILFKNLLVSTQRWLTIFILIICIVTAIIFIIKGFQYAFTLGSAQRSPALGISLNLVYSAMPVGFTLISYYLSCEMINHLKKMRRKI